MANSLAIDPPPRAVIGDSGGASGNGLRGGARPAFRRVYTPIDIHFQADHEAGQLGRALRDARHGRRSDGSAPRYVVVWPSPATAIRTQNGIISLTTSDAVRRHFGPEVPTDRKFGPVFALPASNYNAKIWNERTPAHSVDATSCGLQPSPYNEDRPGR